MKILKYLLYAVAALGVLFIAAGFVKPTAGYGNEIEVNKPLRESWAVYQDMSKLGDWINGFKSMELISGEKGTVGSKYKIIVHPEEGEYIELIETITSLQDQESMGLEFDSEFMTNNLLVNFSEKEGKTYIKTNATVRGKGMFMRSLMALMEGPMGNEDLKNMTALKKLIEENTTDYFPDPETVTETADEKSPEGANEASE